jgi:hypothetical protein
MGDAGGWAMRGAGAALRSGVQSAPRRHKAGTVACGIPPEPSLFRFRAGRNCCSGLWPRFLTVNCEKGMMTPCIAGRPLEPVN